ncbi:hypothetical protein GH714_012683 [Hevea brasiliensis]|uniref:Transcription factor MYC/MYB N-terminal domain-containing protein n=1 Tax=Hevea brasiliensis TaxID=3981 RepID=A0A6A6NGS1_HEVBR|nr:hypothetical protein GH714_012683 [Hevea brasiliensis]
MEDPCLGGWVCDFYECERPGSGCMRGKFGADVFFKMSHEVYNYGEGLVGKVAADNSHKWVFRETPSESDPNFISSWNMSIEPIVEDLNLVINVQRKFSYLQSLPGVLLYKDHTYNQDPYILKPNTRMIESQETAFSIDDKRQNKWSKEIVR